MSAKTLVRYGLASALSLALLSAHPASAATAETAELAYWQSIQASQDPNDFRDYLKQFPDGVFAPIAKSRIRKLEAGGTPAPAAPMPTANTAPGTPAPVAPAPVATAPAQPTVEPYQEQLIVTPSVIRVGEQVKVTMKNFPTSTGTYPDMITVVRAGSPEDSPQMSRPDRKNYASEYVPNYLKQGFVMVGPFPPGNYEVRYVTVLYSDDQSYQVRTKALFSVR